MRQRIRQAVIRSWAAIALALCGQCLATQATADPSAVSAPDWVGPSVEHYQTGDVSAKTPGAVVPGLGLFGGGDWPLDAWRAFADQAGGGHLVVLRAHGGAELQDEIWQSVDGLTSIETLVIHDREAADDPRVQAVIAHADGIFIGGGDQSYYVRAWRNTAINRLLDAHLAAGKPIGGTSAGLAVLGAYAYGCLDSVSMTATLALHDPTAPGVTLVRNFLHLPYLTDVITDTHFAKRKRQGRLIAFVARLIQEEHNPSISGLGVDEDTALIVDGAGIGHFYTRGHGYAWLVRPLHAPERIVAGAPLTMAAFPIVGIGPQSTIDFKTFRVDQPAFVAKAVVSRGALRLDGAPELADAREDIDD